MKKKVAFCVLAFLTSIILTIFFIINTQLYLDMGSSEEGTIKIYYDNGKKENFFDEQHVRVEQYMSDKVFDVHVPLLSLGKIRVDILSQEEISLYGTGVKLFGIDLAYQNANELNIAGISNIKITQQSNCLKLSSEEGYSFVFIENNDILLAFLNVFIISLGCGLLISWLYIYGSGYIKLERILTLTKKRAVIISLVIFFTVRVTFLLYHMGYFAFDEFYHISTLNPLYFTDYNRADYINLMVKMFCNLLGYSDFVVKLIPLILGSISFITGLYLMYKLYESPYWIVILSAVLSFMPYVIYNHFYIRMYVFLEAAFMVSALLVYKLMVVSGKKRYIYLLLSVFITLAYSLNTVDFSSWGFLLLMAVVLGYVGVIKVVPANFFKSHIYRVGITIATILIAVCVAGIIMIKQGWIEISALKDISAISGAGINLDELLFEFYHSERPVFFIFLFVQTLLVTIPFVISLISTWKKNEIEEKPIFLMALLPMLGYIILFYNSYIIRSYIAFWPLLCILAYRKFDKLKLANIQYCIIGVGVVLSVSLIQQNFWEEPTIPNETGSSDLGNAVKYARSLEEQGYEIVPMMTYITQSAYFDLLDTEKNINVEDIKEKFLKENYGSTSEAENYIENVIEGLLVDHQKYAIIVDQNGNGMLGNLSLKQKLNDKAQIKNFEGNVCVYKLN